MIYSNHLKSTALIATFLLGMISLAGGNTGDVKSFNEDQSERFIVECDEIDVKLNITHTSDGKKNGKIEMNFEKPATSYTCFIFSGADNNNRLAVKDNEINDLEKGEYNLYIQDKKGCTKRIEFKIN
jgi:hypothetical protein